MVGRFPAGCARAATGHAAAARASGSFDPRQIDAEIVQAALFPADWLPKPRRLR